VNISDAGLQFICAEEGCRLHVYPDQRGIPTIGVGHRLLPGESYPNGITQAQAIELLRKDVSWAMSVVNGAVTVQLSQCQADTLYSFCFNVGSGNFRSSSLLRLLNQGEYSFVPGQLMQWIRVDGEIDKGLENRRKAEGKLWVSCAKAA
jgi:lysozyme